MGKEDSRKTRNRIVYTLIFVAIIGITVAVWLGVEQDEKYKDDARRTSIFSQQMEEGKYIEAEKTIKKLVSDYPTSYVLLWQYGRCLALQGKDREAYKYYEKTRIQRPFVVRNSQYLLHAGETLYKLGDYEKARIYLTKGKELEASPQTIQQIDAFLQKIEHRK